MRIISKQHDYYDSIQRYGQDQTRIYKRLETEIEVESILRFSGKIREWVGHEAWINLIEERMRVFYFSHIVGSHRDRIGDSYMNPILIGFAGKIYPCMELIIGSRGKTTYCYDLKTIKNLIKKYRHKWYKDLSKNEKKRYKYWWRNDSFKDAEDFFNIDQNKCKHLFLENQIGIFTIKNIQSNMFKVTLNDSNLKRFNFQTCLDPYTAFQELEMFSTNELKLNEPKTIDIADKYKVEQHGFDKWSFRKQSKV